MENGKKQNKKIELLLADLRTEVAGKVKTALDGLQLEGNYTIIEPLFTFIANAKNDEAKNLVIEFLCNLKDSKSKLMVMDCLEQARFSTIQNTILNTIWNSPLDYSEYIHDFVKLAVANEFMTTLECLTIIENLDGPFEEQHLYEAQLALKDYHDGKYIKSKEKDEFISEIALLIKDFDNNTVD